MTPSLETPWVEFDRPDVLEDVCLPGLLRYEPVRLQAYKLGFCSSPYSAGINLSCSPGSAEYGECGQLVVRFPSLERADDLDQSGASLELVSRYRALGMFVVVEACLCTMRTGRELSLLCGT